MIFNADCGHLTKASAATRICPECNERLVSAMVEFSLICNELVTFTDIGDEAALREVRKAIAELNAMKRELQIMQDRSAENFVAKVAAEQHASRLENEIAEMYRYATRLFLSMHPECEALDSLPRVMTQIDNAIYGLNHDYRAIAQHASRLEAVLRKFVAAEDTYRAMTGYHEDSSDDILRKAYHEAKAALSAEDGK